MGKLIDTTKTRECDACRGLKRNEHRDDACPRCHGTGEIPGKRAVVFESDDPAEVLAKSHELEAADEGSRYMISGFDSTELPDIEAEP